MVNSRQGYVVVIGHMCVSKPDSDEEQYYETKEEAEQALRELESHITKESEAE